MNFNVYKSSAGSGKTFTLVKNYLSLALKDSPLEFRNILAITFTNKAANEMKERIINVLQDLSTKQEKDEPKKTFCKEFGISEAELKQKAALVLRYILHDYSDFAVSTIDSFVNKIIRTFAHDLKIPATFEIETDTDKLLSQAVDLLVAKIGDQTPALTTLLIDYAIRKVEDGQSWNVKNKLLQLSKELVNDSSIKYIEELKNFSVADFIELRNSLSNITHSFEKSVALSAQKALVLAKEKGLVEANFSYGKSGVYNFFKKHCNGRIESVVLGARAQEAIAGAWYAKTAPEHIKEKIESIKGELTKCLVEIQQLFEEKGKEYVLYNELLKNVSGLGVLREIEKIIEQIKAQSQIIHISEFNRMIAKIITKDDIPFIYERVGEKYKYLLIDEFQDTSELQWSNLLPLVENSLSVGNQSMVVGDAKQAIYRWRGGNVEQFVDLPIVKKGSYKLSGYHEQVLNRNYRSSPEVIKFNNLFFQSLERLFSPYMQKIYTDHIQEYNQVETGGYVSIDFLEKKEMQEGIHMHKILQYVKESLDSGFSFNEIAILCRSNDNGSLIAQYLLQHDIPVISNEALLLKKSKEINFVIEFLRLLDNKQNQTALAFVINYLESNNSIKEKLISFFSPYDVNEFKRTIQTNFSIDIEGLSSMPLLQCIETIVGVIVKGAISKRYYYTFIDEVFLFTQKYGNNLRKFIEHWDLKSYKPSVVIDEKENAVQILTVHKSKGLEFPVVIFPFADWRIKASFNNSWIDISEIEISKLHHILVPNSQKLLQTEYAEIFEDEKQKSLLDVVNVLYVALTRPKHHMYILTGSATTPVKGLTTTTEFFTNYLHVNNLYTAGKKKYEFGNKLERVSKKKDETLRIFALKDTYTVLPIFAELNPGTYLSSSQESVRKGVLFHEIISSIKYEKELPEALENLKQKEDVSENEKAELKERVNKLLTNPQFKPFFSDTNKIVYTEKDILVPGDRPYRPDRVVINEDRTLILDFKTGKQEKGHESQLIKYAQVLVSMGYSKVEKYLLYTDKELLVRLD